MALLTGISQCRSSDSSGNCIDKQFASLDVRAGGERGRLQQGILDGQDDEVVGGLKVGEASLWAHKNDQVA
jgi:hypothetical protein